VKRLFAPGAAALLLVCGCSSVPRENPAAKSANPSPQTAGTQTAAPLRGNCPAFHPTALIELKIDLFHEYTGKTIDDLWTEFADSLRHEQKKPPAA